MGHKLTPTTNDAMKIVAPHEPLRTGEGRDLPNIGQFKHPASTLGQFDLNVTKRSSTEEQKMNAIRKIALVGTAPSSRNLAPFGDPEWEIWACSAGNMNQIPRVDAWFEIHSNLLWPENEHFGRPYIEWLNQQKFPVYMQDTTLVPRATPLPVDALVEDFGPFFFTSSFAWMMAMAMREGAKEIALYGIDMASRDEYILQRPGAFYFFMEARRRGIKIKAPYESDIMQPPGLYGFADSTPFGRKMAAREKELKDRVSGMKSQRDHLNNNITYLEGAIEDLDYIRNIWSGIGRTRKEG